MHQGDGVQPCRPPGRLDHIELRGRGRLQFGLQSRKGKIDRAGIARRVRKASAGKQLFPFLFFLFLIDVRKCSENSSETNAGVRVGLAPLLRNIGRHTRPCSPPGQGDAQWRVYVMASGSADPKDLLLTVSTLRFFTAYDPGQKYSRPR